MGKTAYIFDVDLTLLDTARLKDDLPKMCASAFPGVSEELFRDKYRQFKEENDGRVDMPEIMQNIAKSTGVDEAVTSRMIGWLETIPFRDYMYDPDNRLIRELGPDNVFIQTRGDNKYHRGKIENCGFNGILPDGHVMIATDKTEAEIGYLTGQLHGQGFSRLVFVNDNIQELRTAYEATSGDATCVLVDQGPYADRSRLDGASFPYMIADNHSELREILMPLGKNPETGSAAGSERGF
jgi:phosphoglycolate phosphatase-like HAD superfamily hydrolase